MTTINNFELMRGKKVTIPGHFNEPVVLEAVREIR
jgi:hypothetical protein